MKGLLQACGRGQEHLAGAAVQPGPGDRSKRRPEAAAAGELWPWDCRQEGARPAPAPAPAPSAPLQRGRRRAGAGREGPEDRRRERPGLATGEPGQGRFCGQN